MQKMDRFVLVLLVLALAGCGGSGTGGPAGTSSVDYAAVRSMSSLYSQYLRTHGDRTPADEKVFRDYLATKQQDLERAGITVDKMFTSPRNDQPLVWVYGSIPPSSAELGRCFAYEAASTDGKRFVIADAGRFTLMDEAQFKTVFPNVR